MRERVVEVVIASRPGRHRDACAFFFSVCSGLRWVIIRGRGRGEGTEANRTSHQAGQTRPAYKWWFQVEFRSVLDRLVAKNIDWYPRNDR